MADKRKTTAGMFAWLSSLAIVSKVKPIDVCIPAQRLLQQIDEARERKSIKIARRIMNTMRAKSDG